jgi:hypothetical protein
MAQKVQVLLVDDINGTEAAETVTFSLDGASYEIDLTGPNAQKLRDDLSPWVGHARRSGGRKSSRRTTTGGARRGDLGAVREWARNNGHKVSDRGRISADILAAYDKANS